jgi:hypothetical protein
MIRKALASAIAVALALTGLALAGDTAAKAVTLDGNLVCAHCTLHEKDWSDCQTVLQVKGKDDATTNYYLAKNSVSEKFGHACGGAKAVRITGTVMEKDGKSWVEASNIEPKDMKKG